MDRQTGKEQGWSRGVGAGTDSYYEYLIKYWVLGGSQDEHFRARWEQATDEALATLMVYPPGWPFSYLGDLRAAEVDTVLEHLRCFYPGGCACVRLRVGLCVGEMELLPVAARQQPWRALAPITPPSALPTHPLPITCRLNCAGCDLRGCSGRQGQALPGVCLKHDTGLLPALQLHNLGWVGAREPEVHGARVPARLLDWPAGIAWLLASCGGIEHQVVLRPSSLCLPGAEGTAVPAAPAALNLCQPVQVWVRSASILTTALGRSRSWTSATGSGQRCAAYCLQPNHNMQPNWGAGRIKAAPVLLLVLTSAGGRVCVCAMRR